MKYWTMTLLVVALASASQANAGHLFLKHRAAYGASIPGNTTGAPVEHLGTNAAPSPAIHPYSYYAAPAGMARGYYGYGEDNFPYNGRAYGHPYDPWTWPYMSQGYQSSLNRYYEPPVR